MAPTRVLVLFAQEWDRLALADPALQARFEFIHAGFDLFRFPDNARLLVFDARRFVERWTARARRAGVAAVISPHEQFGVSIAAVIARRLGLPGPDPKAVLTAQHKYYARAAIGRALPEANPAWGLVPDGLGDDALPVALPCFVKPVKATFSVLARRIDGLSELRRHLRFGPFERFIIRRLVQPFDDLLAEHPEFAVGARRLIAEELVDGLQVNVDGYADRGRIRILGVVDELMYPGTCAFNRFEYPSSLPTAVQQRLGHVAQRAIRAVGFDHGLFNVELAYDPRDGAIKVIEINPRVASQFITLYEWVDGIKLQEAMLELALGATPRGEARTPPHGCAASFVFRSFDHQPAAPAPGREQVARVRARHPDARLMFYFKRGADRAREMQWLGSHRFAVVNLQGRDRADLYARYRDVCDTLGFGAYAGPEPAPLWSAAGR